MSLGAGVTSGIVFVVERKLTGTLWEDENFDGKKDSTERKLAGATVTLYVDGSADISGGVYDPATKTVKWDLNVSDGQSVTVSFKVKIDGGAYYARIENQCIVDNGASTVYTNKTDNPVGGPPLPPTPPVPPTPPTPPVPPVPPTPPTPPEPQNPPVDKPEVPKPEKPEPPKTDKPGSHGKDAPKTGDSSQMLLWAALMAGSMLEAGRRMAKKGKK